MSMSVQEITRLTNIMSRTRSGRIKMKLCKRISDGMFDYFLAWISSDKEQDRSSCGCCISLPNSIELAKRFGD